MAKYEVTVGMVKEALAATRLDILNALARTWDADETEFETSTLCAVVIMLLKRKDSKGRLEAVSGDLLLAIISCVLALFVGSRILAYVEKIGLLHKFRLVFRANRANMHEVLTLRVSCELFGAFGSRIEKLDESPRRRPRGKTAKKIQLLKNLRGHATCLAYLRNPSASSIVCTS